MTINQAELRAAFGTFITGVTVITTVDEQGRPRGFTANSFTSVSMEPPLLLVCISSSASSCAAFTAGRGFAVNILAEAQKETALVFASKRPDKFETVSWCLGPAGNPVLDDVVAWFDCSRYDSMESGDHIILVGQVKDFGRAAAEPLGFAGGSFFTPKQERSASIAAQAGISIVGAILECEGKIVLLQKDREDELRLPEVGRNGEPANSALLAARLKTRGIDAAINFVFAVFEEPRQNERFVYYRGTAKRLGALQGVLFEPDDLPWHMVRDEATRTMLERYVRERRDGAFGVYSETLHGGKVEHLAAN
jgi:flavin reductase (DIM6/NTAB) family NADH-FMN oxidoreductase RutF